MTDKESASAVDWLTDALASDRPLSVVTTVGRSEPSTAHGDLVADHAQLRQMLFDAPEVRERLRGLLGKRGWASPDHHGRASESKCADYAAELADLAGGLEGHFSYADLDRAVGASRRRHREPTRLAGASTLPTHTSGVPWVSMVVSTDYAVTAKRARRRSPETIAQVAASIAAHVAGRPRGESETVRQHRKRMRDTTPEAVARSIQERGALVSALAHLLVEMAPYRAVQERGEGQATAQIADRAA